MDAAITQQLELLGCTAADASASLPLEQIQLLVELLSKKAEDERKQSMRLQSELQSSMLKVEKLQLSQATEAERDGELLRMTKSQLSTATAELGHTKNENTLLQRRLQQLEDLLHT